MNEVLYCFSSSRWPTTKVNKTVDNKMPSHAGWNLCRCLARIFSRCCLLQISSLFLQRRENARQIWRCLWSSHCVSAIMAHFELCVWGTQDGGPHPITYTPHHLCHSSLWMIPGHLSIPSLSVCPWIALRSHAFADSERWIRWTARQFEEHVQNHFKLQENHVQRSRTNEVMLCYLRSWSISLKWECCCTGVMRP